MKLPRRIDKASLGSFIHDYCSTQGPSPGWEESAIGCEQEIGALFLFRDNSYTWIKEGIHEGSRHVFLVQYV
jgi:hypothetical protein